MKTPKELNQIKRLKALRVLHDGEDLKCKSLDEQIKRLTENTTYIITVNGKAHNYKIGSLTNGEITKKTYTVLIDNSEYQCFSIESMIQKILDHKPLNQDGAKAWYGQGRNMGD